MFRLSRPQAHHRRAGSLLLLLLVTVSWAQSVDPSLEATGPADVLLVAIPSTGPTDPRFEQVVLQGVAVELRKAGLEARATEVTDPGQVSSAPDGRARVARAVREAAALGLTEPQLYASNIGYRRVRDLDNQIAALRAQL